MNQRNSQPTRAHLIVRGWTSAFSFFAVTSPVFHFAFAAEDPVKITFEDHIKPIFREHCTSCHNANDKKSGLALDSYQAVLTGGSGEVTAKKLKAEVHPRTIRWARVGWELR